MRIQWSGVCRSFVLLASAGGLVFACGGGSAPPPSSPEAGSEAAPAQASPAEEPQSAPAAAEAPAPSPPPPATTDTLHNDDELTRAERELAAADRELGGTTATGAAEAKRDDEAPGRGSGPAKPKSTAPQQQPCATTCKAFASLLRARDSICRIDGSDGERCNRANQIVERHTARGTSCGCNG